MPVYPNSRWPLPRNTRSFFHVRWRVAGLVKQNELGQVVIQFDDADSELSQADHCPLVYVLNTILLLNAHCEFAMDDFSKRGRIQDTVTCGML